MSPNLVKNLLNPEQVSLISVGLLFLLRVMPIMSQAVFFASTILPSSVKIMFSLSLFTIMFPKLFLQFSLPPFFHPSMIFLSIKEVIVGFIIGFLSTIPFQIATSAGMILDFQRGSSSLSAHDPVMRNQSSPLGLFYNHILVVFFFLSGGVNAFVEMIFNSYEILPIDKFPLMETIFSENSLFWQEIFGIFHFMLASFLQLAAPSLISILMTDTFLGIANRLAPQVQITFLGLPLKSLFGIGALAIALYIIVPEMSKKGTLWIQTMHNMLRSLK